ncbi:MAG: hypothetical protein AAF696_34640, partial [Bacteroidota bacterium]
LASGKMAEAKDYFEKALGEKSEMPHQVKMGMALIKLKEGDREEGLSELKEAFQEGKYPTSTLKKHPVLKNFKKDKSVKSLISRYGR